jgi:hypothetical protein
MSVLQPMAVSVRVRAGHGGAIKPLNTFVCAHEPKNAAQRVARSLQTLRHVPLGTSLSSTPLGASDLDAAGIGAMPRLAILAKPSRARVLRSNEWHSLRF